MKIRFNIFRHITDAVDGRLYFAQRELRFGFDGVQWGWHYIYEDHIH